ncbi:hypothetical protein [Borrelia sp. RT1S]|uniref:hypothetical protein n=1 Tax=Borrelia sp. RT1S TaxID=2898580 RepID=UPI001E45F45B|nr:hypothetical protein [Borrelia sp. RT1S]UGQ17937.1 hypothetical protein LSO05_05755 [Borrelia sp. RT1S]
MGWGGPRRAEYSAPVASKHKLEKPELDASELDRMKQRRERLKKANEEREAAIALNRQMRMDKFTKGKP